MLHIRYEPWLSKKWFERLLTCIEQNNASFATVSELHQVGFVTFFTLLWMQSWSGHCWERDSNARPTTHSAFVKSLLLEEGWGSYWEDGGLRGKSVSRGRLVCAAGCMQENITLRRSKLLPL